MKEVSTYILHKKSEYSFLFTKLLKSSVIKSFHDYYRDLETVNFFNGDSTEHLLKLMIGKDKVKFLARLVI